MRERLDQNRLVNFRVQMIIPARLGAGLRSNLERLTIFRGMAVGLGQSEQEQEGTK